jgi:hypothetical protein
MSLVVVVGPAWGQEKSSTTKEKQQSAKEQQSSREQQSAKDQQPSREKKESNRVVRTFGAEGGYRTEVVSEAVEAPSGYDDLRQLSLLMAATFEHIDKAIVRLTADEPKEAQKEVVKAREAVQTIRKMQPKSIVHTKTLAPDGKAVFEDELEVQDARIPLYEGILHARTLAPILAARRNVMETAGVQVVESERIITEAFADLEVIEAQLSRAAKFLENDKTNEASRALADSLIRGIDFRYRKEDTELASARDALWLARRSLEENNVTQAMTNLEAARQRLRLYREVLPPEQRQDVDKMLREVEQLGGQLRQETASRPATSADRTRHTQTVTHWWDRVNGWFRRH